MALHYFLVLEACSFCYITFDLFVLVACSCEAGSLRIDMAIDWAQSGIVASVMEILRTIYTTYGQIRLRDEFRRNRNRSQIMAL